MIPCRILRTCSSIIVTVQFLISNPCDAQIVSITWNGVTERVVSGEAVLAVVSDSGYAKLESILDYFGATIYHHLQNDNIYLLKFDTTHSVVKFCDSLNTNTNTDFCEPSYIFEAATNDTYWEQQWNYRNTGQLGGAPGADIMLEEAHSITRGSASIKVAILDSGIPIDVETNVLNHPDLDDSTRLQLGCICNTLGDDSTINDGNGHGAAVASIVAAKRDNNYGTTGVAPSCTAVIEKIADESANTSLVAILQAIDSAALLYNIDILNMSYSRREELSSALTQKIEEYGDSLGWLFCFPTYNDAEHRVAYPANLADNHEFVIAVGGTNPSDNIWRFWDTSEPNNCRGSNWGPEITCAAPAGGLGCVAEIPEDSCVAELILARWNYDLDPLCEAETDERVRYNSGTSYASPTVAGIAALLLSFDSTLTASEIKGLVMESADDVNADSFPGWDEYLGAGRVNAFKALLRAPGVKTLISDLRVRKHIYDSVSPYYLESGLIVPDSVTLTLDPGVHITMGPNAYILVNGSLVANGTANDIIQIEAADTGERWNGLTINGGSVDMDYVNFRDFKDHGLYVESPDAVSISNVDLNCSGLKYQGIGLRLWNSPTVTQSVSNLTVHSVPADSQIAGMYLYNCKVNFSGVTIEDCDWINSYIKKITGNFRGCTFQDRTEYYGVLFGSTPNVPNFRCCDFANLAPPTGNWPTTIYCYAGTSPSFGGEGDTGGSGVSNVITDESDYLMIMRGSLALPVVDSDPPQPPYVGTSNGGKNNWKNLQTGGKYFQWVDPGTTTYPCTEQWWANGVDSTMFTPSTPARWDFDPEASVEWGLCGGGEGGGIEDSYNGGEIARNNGDNLDDNEYDDILKTAFVFEADEDYAAAQELFRYVAENSPDTYQRWTALSHVVVCEAFIGTGQSWVPDLLTDLIEGESSYEAHVQGERLRVSFYQNREEYENAIEYCVDLLNSGLTYEDSIHVAMDLMGLQMSAEVGGGSLDGMSATQLIPVELKAQNDSEALQIERSLFALLNSGHEGEQDSKSLPDEFKLHDAYPNPFNSNTTITFEIPVTTNGSLKIFNIRGQLVETLMSGTLTAGYHSINYNAENLSTGLYFYRLEWGDHSVTKKMLLLR
jgi:tetratricopeptide (TPR) repeat protein